LLLVGWAMLGFDAALRRYCYPFVWVPFCSSWSRQLLVAEGTSWMLLERWRPVISLAVGARLRLFLGDWNYYSYPEWDLPHPGAQFLHVFEDAAAGFTALHSVRTRTLRLRTSYGPAPRGYAFNQRYWRLLVAEPSSALLSAGGASQLKF